MEGEQFQCLKDGKSNPKTESGVSKNQEDLGAILSSESQLGKNGRASQLRESNMPKVATFQSSILVQDPSDQQMSFAGENYMLKAQHHTMMTNSTSESHFARYSKLQNCMDKLSQTDKGR